MKLKTVFAGLMAGTLLVSSAFAATPEKMTAEQKAVPATTMSAKAITLPEGSVPMEKIVLENGAAELTSAITITVTEGDESGTFSAVEDYDIVDNGDGTITMTHRVTGEVITITMAKEAVEATPLQPAE